MKLNIFLQVQWTEYLKELQKLRELLMSISIETVRVGKDYYLVNYGEIHEFTVTKATGYKDFLCKDLHSLEEFKLSELTAYGKGKDFEFYGLDD